jgi:hypothetical protein
MILGDTVISARTIEFFAGSNFAQSISLIAFFDCIFCVDMFGRDTTPKLPLFKFGVLAELIVPVYFCPHLCFVQTQVGRGDEQEARGCREAVLLELPLDELPSFKHAAGRISIVCQPSASASFVVVIRRMLHKRLGLPTGDRVDVIGIKKNSTQA